MTRWNTMTAAGLVAVLAGTVSGQPDGPLDLERVTLYRSGVGSFEWRGVIQGDEDLSLRFGRDQISDILKSMVLLDAGGGRVEAVGYDSKQPLEKRLSGFAIDVGGGSMQEILAELRGTRVRISEPGRTSEGTVVGLGFREATGGTGPASRVQYVNLLTDGGMRPIEIGNISQMIVLDERLAGELRGALSALAESSNAASATVDLRFRGEGVRPVIVNYVHESPVWKTSYRLVLPETISSGGSGGEATLQGWAIVENTTDADWDDIGLTLVAGRPVGFTMDLYEPLFLERPEVPVPVETAAGPKVYESEIARTIAPEMMDGAALGIPPQPSSARGGRGWNAFSSEDVAEYAPAARASAGQRGELFVYELDEPVTIERQRSAMIPLLTSAIDARRVSIYNERDLADHPMRGVELTNDSDLKLMPGPVTVFDGGAFAGDAQIGSLAKGEKRLLAHAVDLDVLADVSRADHRKLSSVSISGRALRRTFRSVSSVTYSFTNRADEDRVVVIEVPSRPGWERISLTSDVETTPSGFRIELTVPAGGSAERSVGFERVDSDVVGLTDRPLDRIIREVRGQRVSDGIVEALQRAAALEAAAAKARERVNALDAEQGRLVNEQSRLRANLGAVSRDSDLYRRYLAGLESSEDRLAALAGERADAVEARDAALAAFESYLRDLRVD